MSKPYYDSERLINAVKRQASIPIYQSTFTNEDILEMASEEIDISVVPTIMELHEDYFLHEDVIAIVSGQAAYEIPYRAIGNKLRDVSFRDSSSNIHELTRISIDQLPDYNTSGSTTDVPRHYYVRNNQVVLVPASTATSGNLVFSYYFRPNRLVENSKAGIIISINTATNQIILDELPSTLVAGVDVDLIQQRSPHKTLAYDLTITGVTSTAKTITLSSLPDGLRVGDHVAVAQQCIIPQIPSELHPMLVERVVHRIMEAQGDAQGIQIATARVTEMETKTGKLIDSRVEASPQKIVNRNGFIRRRGLRNPVR